MRRWQTVAPWLLLSFVPACFPPPLTARDGADDADVRADADAGDASAEVDGVEDSEVANEVDGVADSDTVSEVDAVEDSDVASEVDGVADSDVASEVEAVADSDVASDTDGVADSDIMDGVDAVADSDVAVEVDGVEDADVGPDVVPECTVDEDCARLTTDCIVGRCDDDGTCLGEPQSDVGCDDGARCTTDDVCTGGVCAGTPVVCAALDDCHDAGICDPASGECSQPRRDELSACDDGDVCTAIDDCQSGVCVGSGEPDDTGTDFAVLIDGAGSEGQARIAAIAPGALVAFATDSDSVALGADIAGPYALDFDMFAEGGFANALVTVEYDSSGVLVDHHVLLSSEASSQLALMDMAATGFSVFCLASFNSDIHVGSSDTILQAGAGAVLGQWLANGQFLRAVSIAGHDVFGLLSARPNAVSGLLAAAGSLILQPPSGDLVPIEGVDGGLGAIAETLVSFTTGGALAWHVDIEPVTSGDSGFGLAAPAAITSDSAGTTYVAINVYGDVRVGEDMLSVPSDRWYPYIVAFDDSGGRLWTASLDQSADLYFGSTFDPELVFPIAMSADANSLWIATLAAGPMTYRASALAAFTQNGANRMVVLRVSTHDGSILSIAEASGLPYPIGVSAVGDHAIVWGALDRKQESDFGTISFSGVDGLFLAATAGSSWDWAADIGMLGNALPDGPSHATGFADQSGFWSAFRVRNAASVDGQETLESGTPEGYGDFVSRIDSAHGLECGSRP